MHTPITQQQAEQLLENTTPGKWEINPLSGNVASFGHGEIAGTLSCPSDRELIMAAPELARTVTWLWKKNQQQQARVERLQTGFKAALEEVNDLSEETYNHMAGPFLPATSSDYGLEQGDME